MMRQVSKKFLQEDRKKACLPLRKNGHEESLQRGARTVLFCCSDVEKFALFTKNVHKNVQKRPPNAVNLACARVSDMMQGK